MLQLARGNTLTPDSNDHNSPCGCHYKTGTIIIGILIGVPICITSYQDSLDIPLVYESFDGMISGLFIFNKSLIIFVKISSVVSLFVGILTNNSRALFPFILALFIVAVYLVFGIVFLTLCFLYYDPQLTAIRFDSVLRMMGVRLKSTDYLRQILIHYILHLIFYPLIMYSIYVVNRCRLYIKEWEDYDRLHPTESLRQRSPTVY